MEQHLSVNKIINDLKDGKFEVPGLLADYLVILSASMNVGGNFELEAEIKCAKVWEELRKECQTDRTCDQKIKLTEEYRNWQQMRIANKTVLNVIQSLKKKLKSLSDELGSGQNY